LSARRLSGALSLVRFRQIDALFCECADNILQGDISELALNYTVAFKLRCELLGSRTVSLAQLDVDIMQAQIYNADPVKASQLVLSGRQLPIFI
jgi:hypothetical protein